MRNTFPLLASLAIAGALLSGCANTETKLGRGMSNMTEFARLGEMRRSIEQTALFDQPGGHYATGVIRGLNKTLAREKFYDGIVFHRVIDGFMAQTGCPNGTGTGGSKLGNLPAEFNAEPHVRGVCSMARAQNPNSANSQFFICFDDATFLDRQYTVWGKVIEGMDNVDKIKRGEPVANPDKITSMRVAADVA